MIKMKVIVYSYEKAMEALNLLSEYKLVSLEVYYDNSLGPKHAAYILKYSTLEDYSLAEQHIISKRVVSDYVVLNAVRQFTIFIENMSKGTVNAFSFTYDIFNNKHNCIYSYNEQEEEEVSYENALAMFEDAIVKLGLHKIKTSMYEKVHSSNSKRPKYEELTLGGLMGYLHADSTVSQVTRQIREAEEIRKRAERKIEIDSMYAQEEANELNGTT